jgi:hypothetical protein
MACKEEDGDDHSEDLKLRFAKKREDSRKINVAPAKGKDQMKLEVKKHLHKEAHDAANPQHTSSPGVSGSLVRRGYRIDEEGAICRLYSDDSEIHDVNSKNGEPYCENIILNNVNYVQCMLQTTHGVIIPPGKNGGNWTCKSK